jgi:zinc transporter ZupT
VLVAVVAALSFLLLFAVGRRRGRPEGIALAFYIALGIGLHNLGEGLAIGAAFAAGAAGLGTFLVLGFTLHNITEGIGIAAPMLRLRPRLHVFAGLVLLAGGPAVVGMWLGSLATAPQWAAIALAVGAGAILQVIVEIGDHLRREGAGGGNALLSAPVLGGFTLGVVLMYATALIVKI